MKNKVLIGVAIVLSALLGCLPEKSGKTQKPNQAMADTNTAAQQDSREVEVAHGKGHSAGNPNRRTWVVYQYTELDTEHISPGDAFRIQKTGSTYKLRALTLLRDRWSKPASFVVDLVEGGDNLLCGQVDLDGHTAEKEHVFKFMELGADELEVQIELFDNTKSLDDQCVPSGLIHGGRAHAEN